MEEAGEVPAARRLTGEGGRRLISRSPFRETGYSLLMRALFAQGNAAEALLVYERLRRLLYDELGTIPPVRVTICVPTCAVVP